MADYPAAVFGPDDLPTEEEYYGTDSANSGGEPAFPAAWMPVGENSGFSKREYFAGLANAGDTVQGWV